jgi:hypothetical protein
MTPDASDIEAMRDYDRRKWPNRERQSDSCTPNDRKHDINFCPRNSKDYLIVRKSREVYVYDHHALMMVFEVDVPAISFPGRGSRILTLELETRYSC